MNFLFTLTTSNALKNVWLLLEIPKHLLTSKYFKNSSFIKSNYKY